MMGREADKGGRLPTLTLVSQALWAGMRGRGRGRDWTAPDCDNMMATRLVLLHSCPGFRGNVSKYKNHIQEDRGSRIKVPFKL